MSQPFREGMPPTAPTDVPLPPDVAFLNYAFNDPGGRWARDFGAVAGGSVCAIGGITVVVGNYHKATYSGDETIRTNAEYIRQLEEQNDHSREDVTLLTQPRDGRPPDDRGTKLILNEVHDREGIIAGVKNQDAYLRHHRPDAGATATEAILPVATCTLIGIIVCAAGTTALHRLMSRPKR